MLRRPELLESLSQLPRDPFSGVVFRATRNNLNPGTASTSGGRWMPPDRSPILYTSLVSDGALAEMSYRQLLLDPIPSKAIFLHRLRVDLKRVVQISRTDLERLGVLTAEYQSLNYPKTQEIGDAACFLGFDGAIVPSARWECENLVIFEANLKDGATFEPIDFEEVDWRRWAKANGLLP